ncbi:MAG: FlgD immunoglobulin-like domain containing protein [Candidatus Cloacimonadales bacterium]|nr:FlgD immunoglobulin-like domain containing protein [Candidatus Cloacimonadales bacterium]
MNKFIIFIFFLLLFSALFAVIEETESLQNFLYGSAPGCDYDNWMSHITEGIASPGYNIYAPWDRQTNSFGIYIVPSDSTLIVWAHIIDEFLLGNLDSAQDSINYYWIPYQVVIFHDTDTDRTFHLLREVPNLEYFDDNGTADPDDDEYGAFDHSWGLYIYYPAGIYPHITTVPHPTDDFITIPLAHKVFIEQGSKFLLINGCGREVAWTNVGNYDNSKSICDPSRRETHTFNVAYQRFCDLIRIEFATSEFSLQVHSFDWGESHKGYSDVQISGGYHVGSPDLPIRDHSSLKLDVPNFCNEIVIPANYVGLHDPVHLNDYFGFHSSEYEFTFANVDTTFAVNTNSDLWGWNQNRQMVYTVSGMSQYDNFERFFHIEVDELPNTYPPLVSNYYWFHGWNPVTQKWEMENRFDNALQYNQPWIDALQASLLHVYEMNDNEIPIAPSNLEVFTESADKIILDWTKGDCYDMDSYEILYSIEPIANGNFTIRDRNNNGRLACLAQDNYTLGGLEPGDQYYFAVRIRDKNGNYSELSNEVLGTAGPVIINNFAAYGRDEQINLSWQSGCDTTFSGFNIYRKIAPEDFLLLDSWLTNPNLVGQSGSNIPYSYVNTETENEILYTYKISFEDEGEEYFLGDERQAVSHKIYQLYAHSTTMPIGKTCFFGYNEFASNGYDANFEIPADTTTVGTYFICEFYEQYWDNVPNRLEQEIHAAFDPSRSFRSWIYRIRTNLIDVPVEISIANLERDAERFYLNDGSVYTDLTTSNLIFTPTSTGYYTFTLYWGNLVPNVTFTDFANQLLYPYETVNFNWSLNLLSLIDHVNVYAANDEISIPVALELDPSLSETDWIVPQILMENLQCRVDLVMNEGDTLSYFSPFRFGIIAPQNIVQTEQGWNLITKNFQTNQYSSSQIFGENVEFYAFQNEEFSQIFEPEFLSPYWIYAPQDNYFELNNVEMLRSAYTFSLAAGWNLLPNPHRANYDVKQLVFSLNYQDFEYYQALQNHFIEPAVFSYDEMFNAEEALAPAKSYYLYCHEDGLSVKFIPYYTNEYTPEFDLAWRIKIIAEQVGIAKSSLVVGTAALADSLYNPNYDILKPVHTPFENPLSVYLPLDVNGTTEMMHQSLISPEAAIDEISYSWNAELAVSELLPITFSAEDFEIPEGFEIGLQFEDAFFNLSLSNFVEYTPADTLLSFNVIVSNELAGADDLPLPAEYSLMNFPNPFNPSTTIRFDLPEAGKVKLTIYNIKGQKVKQLVSDQLAAGQHSCVWNGKDESNKQAASGVYFYRLKVEGKKTLTNKMLMLK